MLRRGTCTWILPAVKSKSLTVRKTLNGASQYAVVEFFKTEPLPDFNFEMMK